MDCYKLCLCLTFCLAVTLHESLAVVRNVILTEGDIFNFQCDVVTTSALDVFSNQVHFYKNNEDGTKTDISTNTNVNVPGYSVKIIEETQNNNFFQFLLSRTVDLGDSGTYTCERNDDATALETVVLTVTKVVVDAGKIDFTLKAVDKDGNVIAKEDAYIVSRFAGAEDPTAKVISVYSGFYQAHCIAEGGTPPPVYQVQSGTKTLAYGNTKNILVNTNVTELSCLVEVGDMEHHLQFQLKVNPGHPTITCTSLPAFVGDMNVKIECFVGGHKDLACDQFKWVSKTDDSDYSTKGNYTVQCAVSGGSLETVLTIKKVTAMDFKEDFLLKYDNHLLETYQKTNKISVKQQDTGAGANLVPMGTITLILLSTVALIL